MTSSAFLIPRDSIACSSSTQPGPSVGSSMFTFDGPDMESPPNSDSSSGCNPEELAAAACDNLAASEEASSAPDTEAGTSVPAGSESSEPASTKATTAPPTASTNKSKQKGKSFSRASTSKSEAINLTLQWLSDNYEQIEGMCLPRSVLYTHYLDFCKSSGLTPVSAASFGKVIRQKFPNLTTRRLGTRGQSKYHYYGIGIKETSPYYNTVYSRKGLTRFSATSGNTTRREYGNSLYSPSSKSGTLLPEFPSIKTVQFSSSVVAAKVETFLVMYRTHCQRILDTVVRAYFLEVQDFLMHFWRGMPAHLVSLMASPAIVELVAMCDIITYQAVMEVLIPSNLQPLPESLSQDIREFSRQLPCWLGQAMAELPEGLQGRKLEVSRNFCRMLRRQTSLVHLAQVSYTILKRSVCTSRVLWVKSDFTTLAL
ncbi:transcription factor RFX4-like [Sycon ciliatum]|uniref:transcription factor RFX4-like n=1 Tax=Sycon ciliatum TaxID=27933 RepID=UPI0031F6A48A